MLLIERFGLGWNETVIGWSEAFVCFTTTVSIMMMVLLIETVSSRRISIECALSFLLSVVGCRYHFVFLCYATAKMIIYILYYHSLTLYLTSSHSKCNSRYF